jgi:hypothetical protein
MYGWRQRPSHICSSNCLQGVIMSATFLLASIKCTIMERETSAPLYAVIDYSLCTMTKAKNRLAMTDRGR